MSSVNKFVVLLVTVTGVSVRGVEWNYKFYCKGWNITMKMAFFIHILQKIIIWDYLKTCQHAESYE